MDVASGQGAVLPCSPERGGTGPEIEAQRALLQRPVLSIRLRVIAVFAALFILMAGITTAAVVFVIEVRAKQSFLEKLGNYAYEIQQARRYEKNYFLYGTNLSDAVASVHTARTILNRSQAELQTIVGARDLERMHESLTSYQEPLEQLLERAVTDDRVGHSAELARIEASLRTFGAQIMVDADEMIDRERLAMHTMLHTSLVAAVAFLILMSFVLVFVVRFIMGSVLRPLGRFTRYAARVGAGDYSPITPTRRFRDEFSDLAVAFNQMLCEIKLRQEQLSQSAKMVAVGSLTSGIAHELNNPLNNIALTVEALTDDFAELEDEEKLRMLGQVYTQVERASLTVRDLLDFTRVETSALVSVRIGEVIRSSLKLIGNELALNEIELAVSVPDLLPEITGNPGNLQQVFLNLFLNGIQAMPDGGTLAVQAELREGFVRVDVKDTGVGISRENLGRIFEPFFTTKEVGKGTGLGLYVCHGIIQKHEGRLTVESAAGEGTTFSVFLPIRKEGA